MSYLNSFSASVQERIADLTYNPIIVPFIAEDNKNWGAFAYFESKEAAKDFQKRVFSCVKKQLKKFGIKTFITTFSKYETVVDSSIPEMSCRIYFAKFSEIGEDDTEVNISFTKGVSYEGAHTTLRISYEFISKINKI